MTRSLRLLSGEQFGVVQQQHRKSKGRYPVRMMEVCGDGPFIERLPNEVVLVFVSFTDGKSFWTWSSNATGKYEVLTSGTFLVIPPGCEQGWQIEGALEALVLTLPMKCVSETLGHACPPKVDDVFSALSQFAIEDPFMEVLVKQLWQNLLRDDQAAAALLDGILMALLSQLLFKAAGIDVSSPAIAMPLWRLKRVQQFVDSHLSEPVRLQDLALAAGVSKRHFARSFHQEMGETPIRWLMQRRLDRAKKLLEETDIPLCEVAMMCGFANQSHLTKVLRRSVGSTPQRWRQLFRGLEDHFSGVLV